MTILDIVFIVVKTGFPHLKTCDLSKKLPVYADCTKPGIKNCEKQRRSENIKLV
jgi:hypothetical protein